MFLQAYYLKTTRSLEYVTDIVATVVQPFTVFTAASCLRVLRYASACVRSHFGPGIFLSLLYLPFSPLNGCPILPLAVRPSAISHTHIHTHTHTHTFTHTHSLTHLHTHTHTLTHTHTHSHTHIMKFYNKRA